MDNNYWKEKYADYHSRAESRIAELEEEKEEFRNAYNVILEQCKKEQTENERLKSEVGNLTQTCGSLLNIQYALADSCKKYSETLQEIKEIADAKCNECKYGKDGISCKYGDCGEAKLHLIVQLINKAEEEDETKNT